VAVAIAWDEIEGWLRQAGKAPELGRSLRVKARGRGGHNGVGGCKVRHVSRHKSMDVLDAYGATPNRFGIIPARCTVVLSLLPDYDKWDQGSRAYALGCEFASDRTLLFPNLAAP
jgi:hypothetical protein